VTRPRIGIALAFVLASSGLAQQQRSSLLERLSHPRWIERTKAMREARTKQSPEVLAKLIDLAADEPRQGARRVAIETLGYYPDERIAAILLGIYTSDREQEIIRASALEAMARRGDAGTRERLIASLGGGLLQRAAVKGLVLMPTPKAFDRLAKLHARGHDPMISRNVTRAMLLADRKRALDILFADLGNSRCPNRPEIAGVLRESPGEDVRERCLAAVDEDDLGLQRAAIAVLGKCGNARTVAKLTWLMNENETLRATCARSLGELGGARAVRSLIPYLRDKDAAVRAEVADAVARIGDRKAGEPLVRALRAEEDTRVLMSLVAALGDVREKRAIRDLVDLFDDGRVHAQPMGISSVWTFPYNVPLRYAALWSTRTILDGKPPFDLRKQQMMFGKPLFDEAAFEATQKWWKQHAEDPRYSLDGR